MKIFFNLIKNKKYEYILSLITSGRFNSHSIVKSINSNIKKKFDLLIFSRFLKKGTAKEYSKLRYYFNVFFIHTTHFLTRSNLSDPGSILILLKQNLIYEIDYNKITNGSHFGHFFNVMISLMNIKILELPVVWKEGNIKSHLNSLNYVVILFFSLVKFYFTKNFFKNDQLKFDYELISF